MRKVFFISLSFLFFTDAIHSQQFFNDNLVAGISGSHWQGYKSNGGSGVWGFQQNDVMYVGLGANVYNRGFSANAMGIFNGSITREDIFLYNQNSASGDFLVLKANGNVGIGTVSPSEKLVVAGNLLARKVKVTVDAGADFVFSPRYKLWDLYEVRKFIQLHQHLPGIASAKEMESEGIELADTNIKLLQKIEELTLYLIEQKQEIDVLKQQMNQLLQEKKIKKP